MTAFILAGVVFECVILFVAANMWAANDRLSAVVVGGLLGVALPLVALGAITA